LSWSILISLARSSRAPWFDVIPAADDMAAVEVMVRWLATSVRRASVAVDAVVLRVRREVVVRRRRADDGLRSIK
jgi:hypothetical protein